MDEKFIYSEKGEILRKIELGNKPVNKYKISQNFVLTFISICTAIVVVLAGINTVNLYNYYGISLSLFTYDTKFIFVKLLEVLLVWFGVLFLPMLMYKINSKDWSNKIAKGFIFAIVFIVILYFYNDLLVEYYNDILFFVNNKIVVILFLFIGLQTSFYDIDILWDKEKQKKDFSTNNRIIKKSKGFKVLKMKIIIYLIKGSICIFTYAIIFLITFFNVIGIVQPTKIKNYSTTTINNSNKIILFQTNDKLFIADYIVDGDTCTIYTKRYSVVGFNCISFQNIQFKDVSINKEDILV